MSTKLCGISLGAVVLSAVLLAPRAEAGTYTLPVGGNIIPVGSDFPVGGTLLASVSSPFNGGTLIGTLVSSVYSHDTSNPLGGYTFTYQLSVASNSPDASSEFTVSSFTGFNTDVSYNTNSIGAEVIPSNFTRSTGAGDVVRVVYLTTQVGQNETGALVVVQTDASSFHSTLAGAIDGTTVNMPSFAPVAVPEPTTAAFILGSAGLLLIRHYRRSVRS